MQMTSNLRRGVGATAAAAGLAAVFLFGSTTGPATVLAAKAERPAPPAPKTNDGGSFFKADTLVKLDAIAAATAAATEGHRTISVQTVDKLPAGMDVKAAAERKAADVRLDGVMIYISKAPEKLHVFVGKTTVSQFGSADQKSVVDSLIKAFKARNFDEGILAAATEVSGKLKAGFPLAAATPATGTTAATGSGATGSGLPLWAWIAIGVVGFFIVMRILGALFAPAAPAGMAGAPGYGGGGGGGGGFATGLMGGLFGAMAGNWIYNSMMGGSSHHSGGSSSGGGDSYGASGSGGPDGGEAGGGMSGDFSSGGGGDYGGGDSGGGGDFGGGDSGGGGDF